jgi:pyruvate/2-oxoglutarate dehydrogenase complex dihydrolipoamide acyltransferase (E2) component
MPLIPLVMPQLGESIAEATIVKFLVKPNESVKAGQEIIEVETNKALMTVAAPCEGKVKEFSAKIRQSYPVGSPIGLFQVTEENAAILGNNSDDLSVYGKLEELPSSTDSLHFDFNEENDIKQVTTPTVEPVVGSLPVPAGAGGAGYISPRLRVRMQELGLNAADLSGVAGSGSGGRVTIEDFESFLRNIEQHRLTPASPMRSAVADSMRRSWTRPLATVGSPIILEKLLHHRKNQPLKAGPALYCIRALAIALAENTAVAGRLIGNRIVHPRAIDIGFAVEVDDGVMVPVIKDVDKKPLSTLIPNYLELVELARKRNLPLNSDRPGIATVTNFGTFGIVWATPIPLPEQNLVLGLGAGAKVPHWSEEVQQFIPVTEAELTLSFDHRVLDGGGAGRLLKRVNELLQRPELL